MEVNNLWFGDISAAVASNMKLKVSQLKLSFMLMNKTQSNSEIAVSVGLAHVAGSDPSGLCLHVYPVWLQQTQQRGPTGPRQTDV